MNSFPFMHHRLFHLKLSLNQNIDLTNISNWKKVVILQQGQTQPYKMEVSSIPTIHYNIKSTIGIIPKFHLKLLHIKIIY